MTFQTPIVSPTPAFSPALATSVEPFPVSSLSPAPVDPLNPLSEDGVRAYIQRIKAFPLLSPEEEKDMTERVAATGDRNAAHGLVNSHLRLVVKIAMRYRRYGLPMADVISEGNIGLIKAVSKFEPERGFRLATYAIWWIKASINEYILNSWSLVKIGTVSAQKRIFYNLRKLKAQLGAYDESTLTEEQADHIANALDVRKTDVHAMNGRLMGRDGSLNAPMGEDGDGERLDLLVDDRPSQEDTLAAEEEQKQSVALIHDALQVLNDRERHIITQRHLIEEPVTLESLGDHYGLSRERVRQIEGRALQKLESRLRDRITKNRTAAEESWQAWRKEDRLKAAA